MQEGENAMPNKRLIPHTITLFNFAGENDNYESDYLVTILRNVMCMPHKGSVFSTMGTNSNNSADLYIFERGVIATDKNGNTRQYLPPNEWNECEDKSQYWTIHDNGTDCFIENECQDDTPPEEALYINGVVHYNMGTPRMRHWEVYAR